jgi:tetratricopeptide (TPR) repeat protein
MFNPCVLPQKELSLDKIRKDIHLALQAWKTSGLDSSSFSYLRLFHNKQRYEGRTVHEATTSILEEGMEVLRKQKPEYAKWLREHYVEAEKGSVLQSREAIGEGGLNKRWQKARKALADVIYTLEFNVRKEHQIRQLKRLDEPTYQNLVGAESSLQKLKELLLKSESPWIIAIKGPGGIGKSAQLDYLLRAMIDEDIWDDVVWISAKQKKLSFSGNLYDLGRPPLTKESLQEALFKQLFPGRPLPESFFDETGLALLVDRTKKCPCLICIDDIESAADVDSLLPILQRLANPSKIIFTTRERINDDIIPITHVELSELSQPDALLLVREIAREKQLMDVAEINDKDFSSIYTLVGGNPLALSLVAGQVQMLGLRQVLDDLKKASDDPNKNLFKFIYSRAWEYLDSQARLVLLAMPLLSPEGGEYAMLSHLTQMGVSDLRKALNKLISLSLVQIRGNWNDKRFSIHNLTRTFLHQEVLGTVVALDAEEQSRLTEFGHYLYRAIDFVKKEAQSGASILTEVQRTQALHILGYALEFSVRDTNTWSITRDLLLGLAPKLELSGFHAEWLPYVKQGIIASDKNFDSQSKALLQSYLGLLLRVLGNYEAAHDALILSAIHFEKSGNIVHWAQALTQRAHLYCIQRRHHEARTLLHQVSILLPETDLQHEYIYYVQGLLALNENDPATAEQWFKKSLQLCERQNDKRLIAKRLGNLGTALYAQRQLEQAQAYYERSIALFGEVHDDVQRAMMQMGVGNIYLLRQQPHKALEEYVKAEPSLSRAYEVLHLAMLNVNWAIAKRQLGEWQEAEDRLFNAISRWRQLNDLHRLANALYELGLLYHEQQFIEKAQSAFDEALVCLAKSEPSPARDALQAKIAGCLEQLGATKNATETN